MAEGESFHVLDEYRVTEWKNFALSAPDRVVAALHLGTLPLDSLTRNAFGDGASALDHAIGSAYAAAQEKGDAWTALVDAGVVAALCQLVIGAVPRYRVPLPDSAEADMAAPWYDALSVFFVYFTRFEYPATPTTLKMITILRKNWTPMMKRIWDEPGNSIKPSARHGLERSVVGVMFESIVTCDPSFHLIAYDPSDRTIEVISRFWTYSTIPDVDIRFNTLALNNFLVPEGGFGRHSGPLRHVAQYLGNNPSPPPHLLLQRVLRGASIPYSSTSFLASFAAHFNLPGFDSEHADLSMYLLISLYHSVFTESHVDELMYMALDRQQGRIDSREGGESQHTDFLRALRSDAQPLWTALFTAAVKHLKKPDHLPGAIVVFAVRVMDFVGTALLHSFLSSPAELLDLVITLVRAGLFQTLDDTISVMFTIADMHERLYWIFLYIGAACAGKGESEIKRLVRAHLPRPRILRATYDQWHDSCGDSISSASENDLPLMCDVRKMPWTHLRTLESVVMDPTECGRRACDDKATVSCTACSLHYCSRDCQETDMEEHNLVCGLKDDC